MKKEHPGSGEHRERGHGGRLRNDTDFRQCETRPAIEQGRIDRTQRVILQLNVVKVAAVFKIRPIAVVPEAQGRGLGGRRKGLAGGRCLLDAIDVDLGGATGKAASWTMITKLLKIIDLQQ